MSTLAIYPDSQHESTSDWPRTAEEKTYRAGTTATHGYAEPQYEMMPWTMTSTNSLQHSHHYFPVSSQMVCPSQAVETVVDHELYTPNMPLEESIIKYGSPFFDSAFGDCGTTWPSPNLRNGSVAQACQPYDRYYVPANYVSTRDIATYPASGQFSYRNEDAVDSPMHNTEHDCRGSRACSTNNDTSTPQLNQRVSQAITPIIRRRNQNGSRSSAPSRGRVEKRSSEKEIRNFACPLAIYGCRAAFSAKNEWKRHVSSQHMRLDFWRCDLCSSVNRGPNDFNRKDLFYQHIRRMHPMASESSSPRREPVQKRSRSKKVVEGTARIVERTDEEEFLAKAASRCHHVLREPPQRGACLLCEHAFQGPRAWEDRLEHIGRHHEIDKKQGKLPINPSCWRNDQDTEKWLSQQGLIHKNENGIWRLS